MTKSLKDQNNIRLAGVVTANLALYFVLLKSDSLAVADFQRAFNDARALIPAALAIAILTIANGLIDPQSKARLVFWRWKNPLPGSRAFSELVHYDQRIDVDVLEEKIGQFPNDESTQNAIWYRLYKTIENDPVVYQNHRYYLFKRDYACISILFLMMLGFLGFYQFESWN